MEACWNQDRNPVSFGMEGGWNSDRF